MPSDPLNSGGKSQGWFLDVLVDGREEFFTSPTGKSLNAIYGVLLDDFWELVPCSPRRYLTVERSMWRDLDRLNRWISLQHCALYPTDFYRRLHSHPNLWMYSVWIFVWRKDERELARTQDVTPPPLDRESLRRTTIDLGRGWSLCALLELVCLDHPNLTKQNTKVPGPNIRSWVEEIWYVPSFFFKNSSRVFFSSDRLMVLECSRRSFHGHLFPYFLNDRAALSSFQLMAYGLIYWQIHWLIEYSAVLNR